MTIIYPLFEIETSKTDKLPKPVWLEMEDSDEGCTVKSDCISKNSMTIKVTLNRWVYHSIGLLVMFMFLGSSGIAQKMPSILPNTPEASVLIQNIDYPISYCNGLPNISIPFHTINVQNIQLPVSMSYRSGGFTATEQEGVTGLGWSLSTDIQITRVVNGLDDFRHEWNNQYGYYYQDEGRQCFGYYKLSEQNIGSQEFFDKRFKRALHEEYRGNIDIQPDCFYYSLLSGKSGKFYFQKTEGSPVTIIQVPYTGVKIELLSTTKSTYAKGDFKITDLDGTEYIYRGTDTEINTANVGDLSNDYANNLNGYISSWKCSEIITANKKDKIIFSYEPQVFSYSFSGKDYIQLFYNRTFSQGMYYVGHQPTPVEILAGIVSNSSNTGITSSILTNSTHQDIVCTDLNKSGFFNYSDYYNFSIYNSKIYYTRNSTGAGSAIVVPVQDGSDCDNLIVENNDLKSEVIIRCQERLRLKDVNFPNGNLKFNYISASSQLSSINISNNGLFSITVNFYQTSSGYVDPTISNHPGYSRFAKGSTYYLDSIKVLASQDKLRYRFNYINKVGLANYVKPITTFGEHSNNPQSFNPTVMGGLVLDNMALAGLSPQFVIGKNYMGTQAYYNSTVGGSHLFYGNPESGVLNEIVYPTGLSDKFLWERNRIYSYPNNIDAGGVRIKEIVSSEGIKTLRKRIFKYGRNEGGCGFLKKHVVNNEYMASGENLLTMPLKFNEIDQGLTQPSDGNNFMLKNYYEDADYYTLLEIYNKNYTGIGSSSYSSRNEASVNSSWDAISVAFNATTDPKDEYQYQQLMSSKVRTFHPNNVNNIPFSYSSPVYYDVVTEYQEEGGSHTGKTIYKYNTKAGDIPFGAYKVSEGIYSLHSEWAFGHLISKIDYKSAYLGKWVFTPVRSITNTYKYGSKSGEFGVVLNNRYFTKLTNAKKNKALFNYSPAFFTPSLGGTDRAGFVVMDSSIVKLYFNADSVVETTCFDYDEDLLLAKKVSTLKSSGKTTHTLIDYSNTACPLLARQGRLNSIINKKTYVDNALNESEANIYSNNWLTDQSLVALQKIQTSTLSNPAEDRIVYHAFDNYGNPVDVSKNNDVHLSYIWSYNHTYPVVNGENVTYDLLNAAVSAAGGGNVETFWAGFSAIATDASQQTAWKNFNTALRNNASLSNARLTTYTYAPLIGITSQTDPNGITTYYEYDSFGRLKNVKDHEGNILQQTQYHYQY